MVLQFISFQKPPPLITFSFLLKRTTIASSLQFEDNDKNTKKRKTYSSLSAVEKESQFELDRDKAREALAELDQQLQSLAQKQINPKDKVSYTNLVLEPDDMRDPLREEMPEYSGSFLAYSAISLFMLTILYNIIFITIIKPAVDGGESAPVETTGPVIVQPQALPESPPAATSQG